MTRPLALIPREDERPLAIDLFCGLGGWSDGLLAEGWRVIGFDIEQHVYGEHRYPGQLVVQDVLTLHGSQFKGADLIVASPPCQAYSWMAMPWSRAKQKAADYRSGKLDVRDLTALFDACFRIQREACEAAGRHIPLIVENVRGAQPWVGRARWNFGSFYLWGDVPALMPVTFKAQKFNPDGTNHGQGSWFAIADSKNRGSCGVKNPGLNWSAHADSDYRSSGKGACFRDSAIKNGGGRGLPAISLSGQKTRGHPNIRDGHDHARHLMNPDEHIKLGGSWFGGYRQGQGPRNYGSKSRGRKMASAMIAKIPLRLSRYIAATFHPRSQLQAAE